MQDESLKKRIWLGTFETIEGAARAYHETTRLTCRARARNNFPCNLNSPPTSYKLLFGTLIVKLHKCYLTSLHHKISCSSTTTTEHQHQIDAIVPIAAVAENHYNT
ncbi:hypothetical protein M9H77_11691 [Catharanthus roseus]|uniref:Uncharacterized protein n=1 Tax=Catharanthus roseus TaxID=4058 RepID=A0ACC0BFC8_CATRO|nr:hypothetical protein M9H77_11691 [Catharanthus roseus]